MAYPTLNIVLPGQSYNTTIGGNWRGTVLDMAANGPAGAHEIAIDVPVAMVGRAVLPTPPILASAITLGAPVTAGPISYRTLTVTGPDGTRTYNLPVNGDLLPHLIQTDGKGQMQHWQPHFPRCRVGDITTFTFTP